MKKVSGKRGVWKVLVPLCLALVMCFSFVGCTGSPAEVGGGKNKALAGFVSLDINPSVEFTTDDAGNVTAVRAANEDARVLLSDMKLVGLSLEEAVKQVTAAAEAAGYLTEANKKVKVSAVGETTDATKELGKEAAAGATSGSDMAQVTEESKKSLEREVAKLKELDEKLYADMTPAKLRIIKTIQEYDAQFTNDIGAKMTVKELTAIAKEHYEKFEDMVSDELEDEFDAAVDLATAVIDAKIDRVYGEEYAKKAAILRAVEKVEEKIEDMIENAEIIEADITKLVTDLGLANSDVLAKDGKITVESVEEYIDTLEDEWDDAKTEEEEEAMELKFDAIETLLEKYEETDTLSDAMKALITAVVKDVAIDTLDALEEYADTLEEELEAMEEEITLTEEQEKKIDELEKEKEKIEQDVKKTLKTKIDAAKKALKDAKAQKIEDNKKVA